MIGGQAGLVIGSPVLLAPSHFVVLRFSQLKRGLVVSVVMALVVTVRGFGS